MSHELAPNTFVAESRDLLHDMEEALLALEHSADQDGAVTAAFRAMHTIKGSAGVFGFDAIVEFAHAMEEVIEVIRAGRLPVDDVLVALLLGCRDHVGALIDCLEWEDRLERLDKARVQGRDLLQQLACYGEPAPPAPAGLELAHPGRRAATLAADATNNDCWHISMRFHEDALRHGMDPLSLLRYLSTIGDVRSVVPLFDTMPDAHAMDPQACYVGLELQFAGNRSEQELDDAFEYVREVSTVRTLPPHAPLASYRELFACMPEGADRLGQCLVDGGALSREELAAVLELAASAPAAERASAPALPAAADTSERLPHKRGDGRALRVHAGKLDELIDLVGELVIAGAGVSLCAQRAADGDLREAASNMGRLVELVRDAALGLRMVPVGETFARFKRVVHDLGRELGKDVDLVISGADTELDKSMVEKLSDPLMHLVRNALDHGIEAPAIRAARGKPARGRLHLDAYHESGSIVIAISDDGAGLDPERIQQRAVELGLMAGGATLGDRELLQLVMEPGFSTAPEVTSVSGRGMGMDVVRRNLESLRGSVSVDSVPGQGTSVALRAPLTLAIIDGFLVGVGGATFVLPLEMVVECIELEAQARGTAAAGYINLRGEVLPLLRLREVFDVGGEAARRENIVVVQYAGAQAGLVVDALMGEFQTVIKPLGRLFERLAGISGSTILGTGEVALILDVPGLIDKILQAEAGRQGRPNQKKTSETDRGPGGPEALRAAPTVQ
jgi:two-component system, chemotaxis family, sensor kinase CheA